MSELESVAYSCCSKSNVVTSSLHNTKLNSVFVGVVPCSWEWDSSDLGLLNADGNAMSLAVDDSSNVEYPSCCISPTESDVSTGYLEDALVEFTSKRRRLLLYASDPHYNNETDDHIFQSCWSGSYCSWGDVPENLNWMNPIYNANYDAVSADEPINSSPKSRMSEEESNINLSPEMKTPDLKAFASNHHYEDPHSSSSSSKHPLNSHFIFPQHRNPISGGDSDECDMKKPKKRLVYPFAVVKPGGVEGDITLNDINQRILMPPTRPVRHPVGDFACRPCISGDGTGLSGKAVVGLTRIHTEGRRGSITIIRTKG